MSLYINKYSRSLFSTIYIHLCLIDFTPDKPHHEILASQLQLEFPIWMKKLDLNVDTSKALYSICLTNTPHLNTCISSKLIPEYQYTLFKR